MVARSGEDKLTGVRSKEDYYRDAAQYLNAGERAAAEGGEGVGGTLAFLTRGRHPLSSQGPPLSTVQGSNN